MASSITQVSPPNPSISMDDTSIINKKRPFEDSGSANKKARGGNWLKQVAEMVLVLAAMGKIRAGRRPTEVEVKIMAEARGKLAEVCNEFAPKDVFPRDAFGMVIEDLGFREMKLGIVSQKISIAQKLQLTKQEMEKSEVFPIHSATYTPPESSRSFQNNSSAVHASSNSRTLPYQLPTSEVRPVGSTLLTSTGDHKSSHNSSWSTHTQSVPFNNNTGLLNNATNLNHNKQHQMNLAVNTHNEIAKIVQKVLHPHAPGQRTWTPPSRDYMSKPLTCQTCKSMINEVDNVLICDACEKGYHLRCLQCNPKSVFGDECHEWHCAKCLAISNGKPLPLKYGRVMRNVNMPKRPASSAGGQPCLEKKVTSSDENFNQRLMSANGQDADACSKVLTQNGENGKNEEVVERGDIVKTSENLSTDRENEGALTGSVRDVEWVGGVINEIDGKIYYGSCCVSGTTYKLQDYALFSSTGNNLMPNKLQSMWEDNKTNKKWVTVTCCFFPDDLPAGVGRPCAPEGNEVYESNHETTLAAGLIQGPCQILPPRKISEESVAQTHSQTEDKSKRFFLCKWFFDEKKRLFRDVTY